jgi:hypothetical protein
MPCFGRPIILEPAPFGLRHGIMAEPDMLGEQLRKFSAEVRAYLADFSA